MTALAALFDQKTFTGTAASGGGTFQCDVPIPTDRHARLRAVVIMSRLSGGHLTDAGDLLAECAISNKNGAVSFTTAQVGSANPSNSATLLAADVQAADANFNSVSPPSGAVWTAPAGNNAHLTVTNQGAQSADVLVVVDIIIGGSS